MNTRKQAAHIVLLVIEHGQSLTAALETGLKPVTNNQDKGFIQALCYGICRYYHQLDFILAQLVNKPIKDIDIKILALLGLYQLRYTRVKPYAAISETVSAVGKKTWAKPLLNAVLRNYSRQESILNAAIAHDLVACTSHPAWLAGEINRHWPEYTQALLTANNQQAPMTLRINPLKITRDAYLDLLQRRGLLAHLGQHSPQALILEQATGVETLPGFAEGWLSVQDEAAQLAAKLLAVGPGDRVLDVCAAPGGKTAHILETQPQLQELVAIDVEPTRLKRVHDNLARLHLKATLHHTDATKIASWWDGIPFQRILLDAPCSATGVVRRHPDIKLLRRMTDIQTLAATQQHLLATIWPLLAPGGILLYATCSVLKQENEHITQMFLKQHSDAREWPIVADWGIAQSVGRQILTGDYGMDGFYYARFKKH